jgi:hypothetical protein
MASTTAWTPPVSHRAAPPSWFTGAPATRLWALAAAATYTILHINRGAAAAVSHSSTTTPHHWAFDSHAIYVQGEWYRYFSSLCLFGSIAEMLVGGSLLGTLSRRYEREMGSRVWCTFITWVLAVGVFVEWTIIRLMGYSPMFRWSYQGPYVLVGAFFYYFHTYAPRLNPQFVRVLGITLSDKSWNYLWLGQVAGAGGWSSAAAVVLGWTAAWLFTRIPNLTYYLRYPDWVAHIAVSVAERLGEVNPPLVIARGAAGATGGHGLSPAAAALDAALARGSTPRGVFRRPVAAAAAATVVEPDPEAVEQLVHMGFDRPRVLHALQQAHNDVHRAADILLLSTTS